MHVYFFVQLLIYLFIYLPSSLKKKISKSKICQIFWQNFDNTQTFSHKVKLAIAYPKALLSTTGGALRHHSCVFYIYYASFIMQLVFNHLHNIYKHILHLNQYKVNKMMNLMRSYLLICNGVVDIEIIGSVDLIMRFIDVGEIRFSLLDSLSL